MIVTRKKDAEYKKVIMHRIADIRGGVGIKTSVLGGDVLLEGTPVGAPVNGICEVLKVAKVYEDATNAATDYKVAKGSHFKAGDFLTIKAGDIAYAITAVDKSNAAYDVLTVGTTLGTAVSAGDLLVAAKAQSTTKASKLAVEPVGIVGTTVLDVTPTSNVQSDVWVMAVCKGAEIPAAVVAQMKGIINL